MARETARIVAIGDLLHGQYLQKEGWEPNVVETARGSVSRASILAAIVAVEGAKSVIIDDGTGRMQCRSFERDIACAVGDLVLCIGKIRQFAGTIFLVPEIMKVLDDSRWIEHRKALLAANPPAAIPSSAILESQAQEADAEEVTALNEPHPVAFEKPAERPAEGILDIIARLDSGDGADIDSVIAATGDGAEAKITRLIEEGHVFTNKPGRVKVL